MHEVNENGLCIGIFYLSIGLLLEAYMKNGFLHFLGALICFIECVIQGKILTTTTSTFL